MSGGVQGSISDPIITQSLPVPEYKMGWIVGKKGSYINQLSKKSGAHFSISESTSTEFGTVWKYVQISGTGRAIDRAKKLLHIRLERLEPRSDIPRPTSSSLEKEDVPPLKGEEGVKAELQEEDEICGSDEDFGQSE